MTDTIKALEPHRILAENADKIWNWLHTRGGVAIWRSADLGDPGKTWTCPYLDESGKPKEKQSWKMESAPSRIITDPAEIVVDVPKEIKRFRVAVRMGGNGLQFKCTDASSRKIRAACEKAGENSWHEFDYMSQEAVIYVPGDSKPIAEYIGARNNEVAS